MNRLKSIILDYEVRGLKVVTAFFDGTFKPITIANEIRRMEEILEYNYRICITSQNSLTYVLMNIVVVRVIAKRPMMIVNVQTNLNLKKA